MIISENNKPSTNDFKKLMFRTNRLLNEDAGKRPDHYKDRAGLPLEDDVKAALDECAMNTPFQNTIVKISGQKFPDIVAGKYYGVEVKSTKKDSWTSTGSSILESSRIPDVEHIYMTFGKLGGFPIQFRSKPYEQCLYDIAVTHMPRYRIDMDLTEGNTIFEKMGIPYEELRKMENPVIPVSKYYRSQLSEGESLWWASDTADETVSATIRLWKTIQTDEKKSYIAYGCVNFPEIFRGDYDRYAMWLTSQGIVDPHIRDQFSAGGKEQLRLSNGEFKKFPGVYRRVRENKGRIMRLLMEQESNVYDEEMPSGILAQRIKAWCKDVSKCVRDVDFDDSMEALEILFFEESE